ncbi:hypothetical protein K492DRAFT_197142 [Lichtheimia hyalospora FSU 10163]|nr:hypothetical protein K492DRAFT_197142 [Lichtheimia hyalospora FSU 10163]
MKFTSFFSAVLVFALSAVNAREEPAYLQFLEAPRGPMPRYKIRADLLLSETSYEIVLRPKDSNWIYPDTYESGGRVNYDQMPTGQITAIIDENYNIDYNKTLSIDLFGSGGICRFEGTGVTNDTIAYVEAEGQAHVINHS